MIRDVGMNRFLGAHKVLNKIGDDDIIYIIAEKSQIIYLQQELRNIWQNYLTR